MMSRKVVHFLALWGFAVRFASAGDDPLVNIRARSIKGSGVEYVWEVRRSYLATLPSFDPLTTEVPVSPHQAIAAAREFLRARLPSYEPLGLDICLYRAGIEKNPVARELLIYEISFSYYPPLPPAKEPLHNVMVLMDGKVLVPAEKPEASPK